jgi:hypothetical protein
VTSGASGRPFETSKPITPASAVQARNQATPDLPPLRLLIARVLCWLAWHCWLGWR